MIDGYSLANYAAGQIARLIVIAALVGGGLGALIVWVF